MTVKSPEEDKDQDLASGTKNDTCRQSSDRMRPSKSSISESERLRRKLKFQEKGRVEPRIEEIGIFLSKTTLNSLSLGFDLGFYVGFCLTVSYVHLDHLVFGSYLEIEF